MRRKENMMMKNQTKGNRDVTDINKWVWEVGLPQSEIVDRIGLSSAELETLRQGRDGLSEERRKQIRTTLAQLAEERRVELEQVREKHSKRLDARLAAPKDLTRGSRKETTARSLEGCESVTKKPSPDTESSGHDEEVKGPLPKNEHSGHIIGTVVLISAAMPESDSAGTGGRAQDTVAEPGSCKSLERVYDNALLAGFRLGLDDGKKGERRLHKPVVPDTLRERMQPEDLIKCV
jgi:hypothetical protein